MGDVVTSSYCIDDEVIQSLQFLEFLFRDMVHVSAVGDVAETVSQNRQLVVSASDWDYLYTVDSKWIRVYDVNIPFWSSGVFVFGKCV